jgi:hypothetical protein
MNNARSSMKLYLYDCDMGQGAVEALDLAQAERLARSESGSSVRNVHLATREEVDFHRAKGGWV